MRLRMREMATAIPLIVSSAVCCSSSPEEAVLTQFFAAARLRDTTALASFATVRFEPRIDGIVTNFEVMRAGPEQRSPLRRMGSTRELDASVEGEIVRLSAAGVRSGIDVTHYERQVGSREVTIEAPV